MRLDAMCPSTALRSALCLATLCLAAAGCAAGSADPESTPAPTGLGLPEGDSTWAGTVYRAEGVLLDATLTLHNDGGELTGVLAFDGYTYGGNAYSGGSFALTGAHLPATGRVVLVARAWIEANDDGSYRRPSLELDWDPSTGALSGRSFVNTTYYQEVQVGQPVGGPVALQHVEGDGDRTVPGAGDRGIDRGDWTFEGSARCSATRRTLEGTLSIASSGLITGALAMGGSGGDDFYIGVYPVRGIAGPDSGRIVLLADSWRLEDLAITNYLNLHFDGQWNGADSTIEGDAVASTYDVTECTTDTWEATLTAED